MAQKRGEGLSGFAALAALRSPESIRADEEKKNGQLLAFIDLLGQDDVSEKLPIEKLLTGCGADWSFRDVLDGKNVEPASDDAVRDRLSIDAVEARRVFDEVAALWTERWQRIDTLIETTRAAVRNGRPIFDGQAYRPVGRLDADEIALMQARILKDVEDVLQQAGVVIR